MFDDVSSSALRVALSGLSARQKAIANNVANLETPGYQAQRVQFEDALASAVADGQSPADVTPSTVRSLEPTGLNGNNVNLDEETLSQEDTTMRYQLAIRAMNSQYDQLRTAIQG